MMFIPDSAVLGTYKRAKRLAKKSAKSRVKAVEVIHTPTSLHKQRSVAELRELARHAQ